ncbi:vomeronasal type-1 receptor 90-like [Ochotona curzoniae]|uniref:vomeronasal type-1 receptor 90-like n=1 Tax=Ochotona curzoniae TaxID=130825 RepID=UPI001B34DB36|nr:vomeronasal type-1 receptor 90-like [Ochotona curzoniae]
MKNSEFYNIDLRNIFFCEIGIGISTNAFILLSHIPSFFFQHKPKPIDLTIALLTLTHLLMLITISFIARDTFGSQDFWDDVICKSTFYIYRVLRGLSMCTTCLLSVQQAIILSHNNSCLAKFKRIPSHQSLGSLLLLWACYCTISTHLVFTIIATPNLTSSSLLYITESCSFSPLSYSFSQLFPTLVTFRDVSLIGLMALSSGYMVTLLCRHKRQSQHLHDTSLSLRASPELRATRVILLFLWSFVVLFSLDCTISSFRFMRNSDPNIYCIQILVANGYAIISPFVFLITKKQIILCWKSLWQRAVNV